MFLPHGNKNYSAYFHPVIVPFLFLILWVSDSKGAHTRKHKLLCKIDKNECEPGRGGGGKISNGNGFCFWRLNMMYLQDVIYSGHLEASPDAFVKKAVKSAGSMCRIAQCSVILGDDSMLLDRQENGGVLLPGTSQIVTERDKSQGLPVLELVAGSRLTLCIAAQRCSELSQPQGIPCWGRCWLSHRPRWKWPHHSVVLGSFQGHLLDDTESENRSTAGK